MKKQRITIKNETGLHIRPASELVKIATKFQCDTYITTEEKRVDAKSMLEVMSIGAKPNTEIGIECNGIDENMAMEEIIETINNKFGE
ncbi:MAG: HPr family phosphocarrier protein [Clostridia bacterium]|nr:HPr family phosphocarrier protein [Clostridia bacterium]